jgi:o-succinylbenzoate synthase
VTGPRSASVDLPTSLAPAEVARAEVWLVDLHLRRAHRAAATDMTRRPTVLVALTATDGTVGWGECPALARPTYTGEWAQGAFRALVEVILPDWLAGAPPAIGHPMASGAVADAALDAALRRQGRALASALGVVGASVPSRAIVSAADLDDLGRVVEDHLAAGRRHIGCKVSPAWLLEPLRALRATWPELSLSADGNGQLGDLEPDTWAALDTLGLDEVEQPCPPGDWLGSARVAARLDCPVALDESISSVHDVVTMAHLDAGSVVNVKPARLGGLIRALDLAEVAAELGIDCFVGGMLESAVGRAPALCAAAHIGGGRPTHLGPSSQYWERDLADGIELRSDGTLGVPDGAGVGLAPALDRLREAAAAHVTLPGCR